MQITNKCLSQVLELQHLEDLVLEGCFGIDDDRLTAPELVCKSLEVLIFELVIGNHSKLGHF